MSDVCDPIFLRLTVICVRQDIVLRWEADVLGVRHSRLASPFVRADTALVVRALDVLQDPAYPQAWTLAQEHHFAFTESEIIRLRGLGLWDVSSRIVPDAPRRVGRLLFGAITHDPQGARALSNTRDHAASLGRPLSIDIGFPPGTEHLAALPWELLWDIDPAPLVLARQHHAMISRCLDLPQAVPPSREASGPLRVLVLSPHAGITPEMRQMERAARESAIRPLVECGALEMEAILEVQQASLASAVERFGQPDIVHFYGHGRMTGAEGELLIDSPEGGRWIPASVFAALCGGAGLVVLHACQGAMIPVDAGEPLLGGVAQALCAVGVPAVLGMQFTIRVSAANRVTAALYTAIAAGKSVQEGVVYARRMLFVEEHERISWFVPALYLRARGRELYYLRTPRRTSGTRVEALTGSHSAPSDRGQQSVIVRGGSQIRGVHITGQGSSVQHVVAHGQSCITEVTLHSQSTRHAPQRIIADSGSTIADVHIQQQ